MLGCKLWQSAYVWILNFKVNWNIIDYILFEGDYINLIASLIDEKVFPGVSDGKESACKVGDSSSVLRWRRFPGEENGNPLQCSCLENSIDKGTRWATIQGYSPWGSQRVWQDWATFIFKSPLLHVNDKTCLDMILYSYIPTKKNFWCWVKFGSVKYRSKLL